MSWFEQCHRDGGKKRAPPGHRYDTRHHLYRHHGDRPPGRDMWKRSHSPGLRYHEGNKQVREGIHSQLGHCRLVCDSHCRSSLYRRCVQFSIDISPFAFCMQVNTPPPPNNLSVTKYIYKAISVFLHDTKLFKSYQ